MGEFQVETEQRPERAVVAAQVDPSRLRESDDAFEEIRELLRTAGVEVIGELVQPRREDRRARGYLGRGKLEDLKKLIGDTDPDVVVIDDELTPSQQRNLEDALQRRVLDRTAVILDIFALHAHTAAGKLQVELAQLEYNLTRMRGMWKHLERLGSSGSVGGPGVGTRGPGETQLETDRRLARRRIALLRQRLEQVKGHRDTMRKGRRTSVMPTAALAGYTNAGKSSLLNALTGSTVTARNQLFETLDPTTRAFENRGRRYLLTDTVGFIERLPHQLVDSFASTLEETLTADLIVHVLDASLPDERRRRQLDAVESVLAEIGAGAIPTMLVLNKWDLLDTGARRSVQAQHPDAVAVSARTGEGLDELSERIGRFFQDRFVEVELLVPYAQAGILKELYDAGAPVDRRDAEDGIHATAHLPHEIVGRLREHVVSVDGAPRSGGDTGG